MKKSPKIILIIFRKSKTAQETALNPPLSQFETAKCTHYIISKLTTFRAANSSPLTICM